MKRTSRSIFAILIAIAMVFTTLPMSVFAESGDTPALGQSGTITGFDYIEPVEVEQGTAEADIPFPETVTATVQLDEVATPSQTQADEISVAVAVDAWQIVSWQTYDPNTADRYVFEAVRESLTLPDGVTLPDDFYELPCVAVEVGEVEIEIAPMSITDGGQLTFNGTQLLTGTSSNLDDFRASNTDMPNGTSTTWNIIGSTLYLNNFVYETENPNALELTTDTTAKIHLSGINLIASNCTSNNTWGITLPSGKSITIEGTGKLTAKSGEISSASYVSIAMQVAGSLTIDSGELEVIGRGTAGNFVRGFSRASTGSLTMNGGKIIAQATTSANTIAAIWAQTTALSNVNVVGGADSSADSTLYYHDAYYRTTDVADGTIALYAEITPASGGGTTGKITSNETLGIVGGELKTSSDTTANAALTAQKGTSASDLDGTTKTWYYDSGSSTLYLNNFDFSSEAFEAFKFTDDLKIVLADNSTNTFTSTYSGSPSAASKGLYVTGNLTIEGDTGTLNVTGGNPTTNSSYGLYVASSSGNLTVNGGTITATGGTASSAVSYGAYVSKAIAINGGKLIASGDNCAISGGEDSELNATAKGRVNKDSGELADVSWDLDEEEYIYDCKIGSDVAKYVELTAASGGTPDYTLFVQASENVIRKNNASGDTVTVSGMTWDGSILTMNNVNFETGADTALIMKNGGTIALANSTTNSLKSGGGSDTYGISSEKALVITGTSGILKVTAGDATAKSTGMMLTEGITVSGGTVEVTAGTASNDKVGVMSIGTTTITGNGKLIAKGASMAFFSQGGEPDAVAVGSTSIDGSGKTSATWASMYYNISGANAKYIELTAGSGGTAIDGGSDELVFNNSTLTHASKQTELNALRASGTNMPNGSTSKWNIISGTLYLNNFEFTTSNLLALDVTGANGKISIAGSNSITSTYNGSAYSMGINVDNGLTISGSGSLNATAGASTGNTSDGIYVGGGNLTIEGSATVNATGGSATAISTGIYVSNGDLIVSGTATVNGTGGTSSNSHSDGVSAKTVTVSGGILNAVAGTSHTDSQSRGIYFTATINVTGSGKITAKSNQYAIRGGSSVTVPAAAVKGTTDGATTGLSNASWNTSTRTYVVSGTTAKYVEMTPSGGGGTAPTITTTSLPNGTVGTAYSQTLAAAGTTPITWTIDSGSLPTGLTLSGSTISGTPTTAGISNFTVKATNSAGNNTKSLSITVNAAAVPAATPSIGTQPNGATYTQNDTATAMTVAATVSDGGTLSYQWYSNTANSTTGGTAISGATSASYTPPTTAVGTKYYYVIVKNTKTGASPNTATATSNVVAVVVNAQTYTVSGTVTNYSGGNVSGATVTIMLGNETKGTQTTQSDGTFSFTNITPGLYNLVITTSDGSQKITVIVTVTNANVTVPATSTKLPQYIQNSEVEVTSDAPVQAVVGGLPEVFDTPVADDTKGFTQAELNAIAGGGTGEIKVVVDEMQATADQATIENAASGKTVGLFLDLSVFKTVTDSGGNTISDNQLTELPSLLTIIFDLPTSLQGKTISAIYRVHGNGVDTITTSGAEYFSQSGNTITLHVKKFSTYGLAYTNTNPPTPTPTPSDGSSGGGSSKQDSAPAPNPWLEPTPAQSLATSAKKAQQDSIRTKSTETYGVRKASWPKMNGYRYYHDTMEGNAVQVRLYVDNPTAMKRDILVTGFVKGSIVDSRKAFLEKWFSNKIRVIHMDEIEPWEQNVRIAAKVDLANMDTKKLYFYSYDKKANKYTRITEPKYWIDKNGYLHFYTTYAGDIIISENPLEKR